MSNSRVCLVVPCFNEGIRWNESYWESIATDSRISLLFINDGSTDETLSILQDFCEKYPVSRVLTMVKNSGKAEAVRSGLSLMASSLELEFDWIGFLDADACVPASEIQRFLMITQESPQNNFEAIWASRHKLYGHSIERSAYRHIIGRSIALVLNLGVGDLPKDTQCGLKLFRNSSVFKTILEHSFKTRWLFEIEMLIRWRKVSHSDLNILEEPLRHWKEIPGSKITVRVYPKILKEIIVIKYFQLKSYSTQRPVGRF